MQLIIWSYVPVSKLCPRPGLFSAGNSSELEWLCTEQTLQNMIQQPDDYRAELQVVHIIKINQQYIYGVDSWTRPEHLSQITVQGLYNKGQTKILWVEGLSIILI